MVSLEHTMTSYCDHRDWSRFQIYESVSPTFVQSGSFELESYSRAAHRTLFLSACPYCAAALDIYASPVSSTMWRTTYSDTKYCRICGWWTLQRTLRDEGMTNKETHETLYEGVIRQFDLTTTEPPMAELRRYLERHISDIKFVHPASFERLVVDVYRDFFDCEIRHVGGPGDNGIDAVAVICDVPHLIQVKRREHLGSLESVATVREFVGALVCSGHTRGHIVTTARGFSGAAQDLVENPHLDQYRIELTLVSLDELFKMLRIGNVRLPEVWRSLEQ